MDAGTHQPREQAQQEDGRVEALTQRQESRGEGQRERERHTDREMDRPKGSWNIHIMTLMI